LLENPLATLLLEGRLSAQKPIEVVLQKGEIVFQI
jgi:hypothetical protein